MESELDDERMLTRWFAQGLLPRVAEAIYNREKVPTEIDDWFEEAVKTYNRQQEFSNLRRINNATTNQHTGGKNYYKPSKDPYAMDVDAFRILNPEERTKYISEGRCFLCHQTGHMQNAHYNGTLPPVQGQPDKQIRNNNRGRGNFRGTGRGGYQNNNSTRVRQLNTDESILEDIQETGGLDAYDSETIIKALKSRGAWKEEDEEENKDF